MKKLVKLPFYSWVLLLVLIAQSAWASGEENFERGANSFQSGDYLSAIKHFEAARLQGLNSVALYYNLASSYYKQGDYLQAKRYFKRVAKSEDMKALAEYNLGLIAQKQNDNATARRYLESVIAQEKDSKLAALARSQLTKTPLPDAPLRLFLSINAGYDDNITAAPDDSVSGLSDTFYDIYLSADMLLDGRRNKGWLLNARYFRMDFDDSDSNDSYQTVLGVTRADKLANWNTTIALNYSLNNYGGDDYQSAIKLDVRGRKALSSQGRIYLRYRIEDINSEQAAYNYLQGQRQRARLEYRNYARANNLQLYYELELNDRQQLVTSSYAYDYSPTRHTLRGRYTIISDRKWHYSGELSYRYSDFPASSSFDRDDDLWRAAVSADYRVDKSLKFTSKLQLSDNTSTVNRYEYDKIIIRVGLNAAF